MSCRGIRSILNKPEQLIGDTKLIGDSNGQSKDDAYKEVNAGAAGLGSSINGEVRKGIGEPLQEDYKYYADFFTLKGNRLQLKKDGILWRNDNFKSFFGKQSEVPIEGAYFLKFSNKGGSGSLGPELTTEVFLLAIDKKYAKGLNKSVGNSNSCLDNILIPFVKWCYNVGSHEHCFISIVTASLDNVENNGIGQQFECYTYDDSEDFDLEIKGRTNPSLTSRGVASYAINLMRAWEVFSGDPNARGALDKFGDACEVDNEGYICEFREIRCSRLDIFKDSQGDDN